MSKVLFGMGPLAADLERLGLGDSAPTPATGRPTAYLQPGQMLVAAEPLAVSTLLGSCISVCLWDDKAGVGGINHYLLPSPVGAAEATPRFGTIAIPRLIDRLLELGSRKADLRAKLFGGASMITELGRDERRLGDENATLADDILVAEGIPVVARDVGGHHGRKVVFQTDDGTAWVRRI